MPPRKKARRAASTPSRQAAEHVVEEAPEPMDIDSGKEDFALDAWTDEQEISLFKSMVRWKPVGMHKHFRMIAISENLRNHGYTSANDDHTRIPGIWEKLKGLYNLEALDERENDVGNNISEEKDPAKELFHSFALPEDDFGEDMVAKRVAPEGSQSPPTLQHGESGGSAPGTRRQSIVDETEDPKSSSASTPKQGSLRGTRHRLTGGSQLKEVSVPMTVRGRAGRVKQDAKRDEKDEEGGDNDETNEAGKATPKATSKGASKASGKLSSFRLSVLLAISLGMRDLAHHPLGLAAMASESIVYERSISRGFYYRRTCAFSCPRSVKRDAALGVLRHVLCPGKRSLSTLRTLDFSPTIQGYREDASKGPMLRFEESLPRLPVPSLDETSQRYLKSVKPLLNASEFAATRKAVEGFTKPGSIGHELQKRLVGRRDDPKHKNWIYEWWNDAAYLTYRDPVVPYVSYFYSHRDDRRRRNPAKRAAALTVAVLQFKKDVDNGTLEPEYMRKLPISMESYQWMFNACRIPSQPKDHPVKYDHNEHKYFTVVRKNQFYKVFHEINGQPLSAAELETQFNRIYKIAQKSPGVGILTTENRDIWTSARSALLSAHPSNAAPLRTIEASSFLICLDDATPVTLEERAHQYWHGDGSNRWFDKPLQFIINENGTSGFMGEHSMMDGTPTHRLNDYANMLIFTSKLDLSDPTVRSDLPEPTALNFHIDDAVKKEIHRASTDFDLLIGQHDLKVQAYQGYGKALIKKFKASPDAYVQMIIQLAYHKMYGISRPTYESASTRRFQQGRTETCRSVSEESVAFVNAMADPDVLPEQCVKAFRAAVDAHVKYISDASDGRGVDRHLFGLKKCLEEGEELPEIFKDRAYGYSGTWYLSTSQLSSEYFNGYGWSQVVDEGWGIAYMINENSIQFNIVSKGLGSERMSFWLSEAANDIRDLLLPTLEGPKAKL